MIVRALNGRVYIVRQTEHARQSAVITAHLLPEYMGSPEDQHEVLLATLHHDDGWTCWETEPRLADSGLPVNFSDMEQEEHRKTWERTIFKALYNLSPMGAAVIARHAATFIENYGEENYARHNELIQALSRRAWHELDDQARELRLERSFAPLFLGDALSLVGIAGWNGERQFRIYQDDGAPVDIRAWREGDWTVRVDPWPFAMAELKNVYIDAYSLPAEQAAQASAILRRPGNYLVRVPVDYVPA